MAASSWRWLAAALAMTCGAGAFGCGYSEDEYQAKVRRIRELESSLGDAERERDRLRQRVTELTSENEAMTAQLAQLGVEGRTLRTSLADTQRALEEFRRREQQAQARLAQFRGMLERFRAMVASGRLRVRIVRGRMVVELPAGILFPSGEYTLSPEGQQTLSEVAQVLRTIEARDFQIAGHTDNQPLTSRRIPRDNWDLATLRAVEVTRYLQSQGLPATRLSAAGYGEHQPSQPNDSPEGQAQNRRIEIVLQPNLDELPDLSALESPAQ
ncbi:MAG: OmpA family protein [Deltaproteobacteria bacterium]|nr:OmpA family protein [Deltaproteobacteria bacterium]